MLTANVGIHSALNVDGKLTDLAHAYKCKTGKRRIKMTVKM